MRFLKGRRECRHEWVPVMFSMNYTVGDAKDKCLVYFDTCAKCEAREVSVIRTSGRLVRGEDVKGTLALDRSRWMLMAIPPDISMAVTKAQEKWLADYLARQIDTSKS